MSKKPAEARIENIVAPIIDAHGLFLETVTVTGGHHALVRVTVDLIDGPGSVSADALDVLTREVSHALDEADPIENAYTLEVSTPGAERQLTTPRHFSRTVGHLVEIRTTDGKRLRGRVLEATDQAVTVDTADNRSKKEGGEPTVVEYERVKKARSRVELRSIS
ncbi:MAG: ribosome maturation factor RimP [Actinomycetaceae bacterium]|nr:ribosome maturation factor RimP [Actinomycetaceae bacterium]